MQLTFDVDARTASALLKYAARWDMTPGEIVDSLMRFYKREMHRLYNKRGRKQGKRGGFPPQTCPENRR